MLPAIKAPTLPKKIMRKTIMLSIVLFLNIDKVPLVGFTIQRLSQCTRPQKKEIGFE